MRASGLWSPVPMRLMVLCLWTMAAGLGAQALVFDDGLVYNDFYALDVVTGDGEELTFFDAAFFDGDVPPWPDARGNLGKGRASAPDEMKYFFWVRRVGPLGAVTYPLSFRKISEIRFTGPYGGEADDPPRPAGLVLDGGERDAVVSVHGERFTGFFGNREPTVPGFTAVELVLTDGNVQSVYLKTDGFLGGIDEEFGTYALFWLEHDDIKILRFHNGGRYSRCPECGAVFYDTERTSCPFDETELTESNSSSRQTAER